MTVGHILLQQQFLEDVCFCVLWRCFLSVSQKDFEIVILNFIVLLNFYLPCSLGVLMVCIFFTSSVSRQFK